MSGERFLNASIVKSGDGEPGGWSAIASMPTLDRDNEVIDARALTWPGDSVPVHDRHGGQLVASARPFYRSDGALLVEGRFSSLPRAQAVRTLVREGHLKTMSVVFHNVRAKVVEGIRHITSGELLAVDFEAVPSNREAQILASRGFGTHRPMDRAVRDARKAVIDTLLMLAEADLEEIRRRDAKESLKALAEVEDYLADLEIDDALAEVERVIGRKLP